MTDNIHHLNDRRPANSGSGSLPATPAQAAALLTACLALVRPVGMTDDEAEDWLGAAVSATGGIKLGMLDSACLTARRSCTHHSQIVPTIFAEVDAASARQSRLAEWSAPVAALPAPRPIPDDDFDRIVEERGRALSVAIDRGLIISNGDGTFRRPDAA